MKINIENSIALKESQYFDSVSAALESLEVITKANTELIQSIYDSKQKLEEGEIFIESLTIKILLATKSIIELAKGTKVSALTKERDVKLLDFPSINILTRSVIEAFLTLEYLFFNNLTEEERKFRFYVWQISGYKSRQNLFNKRGQLKESISKKLETEIEEIKKLKTKIEKSPYYKTINTHNLYKLDTYGLPRLESWTKLIKQSILKDSLFENPYKLYSNYAHSEFISLIQVNEKNSLIKGTIENNNAILIALKIIKMINCISIVGLKNKFDFALKVFEQYDDETKELILFWNEFGIE